MITKILRLKFHNLLYHLRLCGEKDLLLFIFCKLKKKTQETRSGHRRLPEEKMAAAGRTEYKPSAMGCLPWLATGR